jgi:error-prone DNA polymerase
MPLSCEYDHIPYVHEQWGGTYKEEAPEDTPKRTRALTRGRPYAELRAASAFSFLDGSSLPEDLIYEAAERGLPAMALVDTNGVYGAPRFYSAAKKAGIRALVGAELVLDEERTAGVTRRQAAGGPAGAAPYFVCSIMTT